MGWVIEYYSTESGVEPAKEYIGQLRPNERKKAYWVLRLLESQDRTPSVYFSKMPGTDQIWECRVDFGSASHRLFAFMDGAEIVLTHGFSKKTRKAPIAEIERAERCRMEHFQRKGIR